MNSLKQDERMSLLQYRREEDFTFSQSGESEDDGYLWSVFNIFCCRICCPNNQVLPQQKPVQPFDRSVKKLRELPFIQPYNQRNCEISPMAACMKTQEKTCQKLLEMASDSNVSLFARNEGFVFQTISSKGSESFNASSVGSNISDVTLQVQGVKRNYCNMPVLRHDNFYDYYQEVDLSRISVWTGNKTNAEILVQKTLRTYLENYKRKSIEGPLLIEREKFAHHRVQACFLPAEEGKFVNFNVALYNNQFSQKLPAVLAIIASSKGTTAHMIKDNNKNGNKLLLNLGGKTYDFKAERLKDVRTRNGGDVESALSDQEELNRKLLIIQIPMTNVKIIEENHKRRARTKSSTRLSGLTAASSSVDDAQISVGKNIGTKKVRAVTQKTLKRDASLPIQVMTQLYKIIDVGDISQEQIKAITQEILAEEKAVANNSTNSLISETGILEGMRGQV